MKAQQAELLTLVPSGQVAVLSVGAALETAARATKAMSDAKAMAVSGEGGGLTGSCTARTLGVQRR